MVCIRFANPKCSGPEYGEWSKSYKNQVEANKLVPSSGRTNRFSLGNKSRSQIDKSGETHPKEVR